MSITKPLTRPHMSILTTFYEAGGAGELDIHCRLVVGHARHPMPGDSQTWLLLVAHGLVAGEGGRILLTEAGREMAEGVIAGRTREAV